MAPCTAPPAFLRYRPISWETGILAVPDNEAPAVGDASPSAVPSKQSAVPSKPSPSASTKKRKSDAPSEQPRKRQSVPTDVDEDDISDMEVNGKAPWENDDDGSGDDDPPNRAPRQPGTRGSARISSRQQGTVQCDPLNEIAGPVAPSSPAIPPPPERTDLSPIDTELSSAGNTFTNVEQPPDVSPVDMPTTFKAPIEDPQNEDPPNESPMDTEATAMDIDETQPRRASTRLSNPQSSQTTSTSTKKNTRTSKSSRTVKKTAKKTTAVHTPSTLASNKWPDYIEHVAPMFSNLTDTTWSSLVDIFYDFEKARGYQDGRLRAGQRPLVLRNWVASRRPQLLDGVLSDKMPATLTLVKNEFWQWWRYLQPVWRNADNSNKPLTDSSRVPGGSWDSLDATGNNGIVNVMVYLCMWGIKVSTDASGRAGWQEALADVRWAFEQMGSTT